MKIRTIKVFQPVHVSNIIHVPDHGKRKEGGGALAHYRHATSRCDTCALQTQLGVITVARVLPHAALQPPRESVGHQKRLRSIFQRRAPVGALHYRCQIGMKTGPRGI